MVFPVKKTSLEIVFTRFGCKLGLKQFYHTKNRITHLALF